MNTGLIAVRYATALLEFAKEANSAECVYGEAKLLTLMFSKMSELRHTLENPVISKAEKRKLLLNAAGGKTSKEYEKFTDLLLENNRENLVQNIMLMFIDLYRKEKNIRYGKLVTAYPVSQATEKNLIKLITNEAGGTLELEKVVNPEILGGFTLEVEGVRWDASVSGQLQQIRNEFTERNSKVL